MNSSLKKIHVFVVALCISLLGIFVCLSSFGEYLEGEYGRNWLFKVRGKTVPPENVVIVSIDKASADYLKLPDNPDRWSRSYYAQLIRQLKLQEPAVIAFNLIFDEKREQENDEMLVAAMESTKNVILSNYLQIRNYSSLIGDGQAVNTYSVEHIIGPGAKFEQAAINVSPFLLPKTSSFVNQFWTYKASAGDIQTFPVSIFQSYIYNNIYSEIVQMLEELSPSVFDGVFSGNSITNKDFIEKQGLIKLALKGEDDMQSRYNSWVGDSEISAVKAQLLTSWVALIQGGDQLYFNHYGPTGTIQTIPFYKALDFLEETNVFHNKVVLIGYSDDLQPEKNQGLYTVFSSQNGGAISAIEIAATAVANLIDNTWLKPLMHWEKILLIVSWGIIITMIFGLFSYGAALVIITILSACYGLIAYNQFIEFQVLLPLFIPLIIQLPVLFVVISFLTYTQNKKHQKKMQELFAFYIPDDVVKKYSKQASMEDLSNYGDLTYGVCVATDVGQYTSLAETMSPMELNRLMNDYYAIMFPLVKRSGGFVSDVIGDAMLAIWAEFEKTQQTRKNACEAALQIKKDIERFNKTQDNYLPTRIGLHYGNMYIGNIGSKEHFEYRATGDTINTATRIEGLNKVLGTHILISFDVVEELSDFITREMGTFILKGKTRPIIIYELLGYQRDMDDSWDSLNIFFKQGLALFRQQQWGDALQFFLEIQKTYPKDGPTLFYIHYLQHHLVTEYPKPGLDQAVVIKLDDVSV